MNLAKMSLSWRDSSGDLKPLRATEAEYYCPRVSPDGKRLVVVIIDSGSWDLWVCEIEQDKMSRVTIPPGLNHWPFWAPDSRHIVFSSNRHSGVNNFYGIRADGVGEAQRLTESKNLQDWFSLSPDGKRLAYSELSLGTGRDILTAPLDLKDPDHPKTGKPELFLRTAANESNPGFSPDGRWLAYTSDESGRSVE